MKVYQTTNQQPWVEALAAGLIKVKTRTSKPIVPVGATVLLHASKSRLWPHWKNLFWTKDMDHEKWERGMIVAVGVVQAVGLSVNIFKRAEYEYWDVLGVEDSWNSAAEFAVRFSHVVRLKKPVKAKGFQAPFATAKPETVAEVLRLNPDAEYLL